MASVSLKEVVRDVVFTQVIGATRERKVLVVDHAALHTISACATMTEVTEAGVTVVEDVRISRKPLPFPAVYLVMPTKENLELIAADFADRKPMYQAAHIFFLSECPDELLQILAKKRMARFTKTVKEVNLLFTPIEQQAFTLDQPDGLHRLYSPKHGAHAEDDRNIIMRLTSVCHHLGEAPVVRYSSNASDRTMKLAMDLQKNIDMLETAKSARADKKKQQSQVLILDRGYDLIAPLIHELTYQAAAMDLLDIKNNVFSFVYKDGADREARRQVILGENDELWLKFRHEHIADVFQQVSDSLQNFAEEAKRTQGLDYSTGSGGMNSLKTLMKKMPQHMAKGRMYATHLALAKDLNAAYSPAVQKCNTKEQNLACGIEGDGITKVHDFVGEIATIVMDRDIELEDKLRCIMMCVLVQQGMAARELSNLLSNGRLPEARCAAIYNMKYLGVDVETEERSRSKKSKLKRKERDEAAYTSARWVPYVKDLMEDIAESTLSLKDFPTVRDGQIEVKSKSKSKSKSIDDDDDDEVHSARKHGGWAQGRAAKREAQSRALPNTPGGARGDKKAYRPRLIVFVMGSMSYNEMRCAYEVSRALDWDVYIGSHAVKAPVDFLNALEVLDKPLAGPAPTDAAAADAGGDGALRFVPGSTQPNLAEDEV